MHTVLQRLHAFSYSVMTGRMAFRLNYAGYSQASKVPFISEDRLTLPEMMKERGYETALFGKWHIGMTFRTEEEQPCTSGTRDIG